MSNLDRRCLIAALLTLSALPAGAAITFSNVTSSSGISDSGETFATAWADLNGDGFPDIFGNKHQYTPTRVFFNESVLSAPGGRGFSEVASQVLNGNFDVIVDTHGVAAADLDNDGDTDVLEVTGAGYVFPVWENDGQGNLTYRGGEWGFSYPTTWSRSGRPPTGGRNALFFDYNGDGRLDALVEARENYVAYRTPTAVFRQDLVNGKPYFVLDESTGVDLANDVACESAEMADLNGDDKLDLICSDASKISRIWDVSQLPFVELRPTVGDEIYNRYPADLAIGDFNGDLLTDIMSPTYWGADYSANLVSTVDGRTVHGWFGDNVPYNSGFNFAASGNVTFEFDWWTAPPNIFIGSGGSNPALSTDLPTMDRQGVGHGDPHHVVITLSQTQAQGVMTPDPTVLKGVYIGYANGMWQVRFSGINTWHVGMVISAQNSISQLASVGGTKIGQGTTGNALLFLQNASHQLVYTPGNVQQVTRSCNAAAAADFDNDMDLDVYFACTGELSNLQNILYENQGDGTFVPVANAGGAEGEMPFGRSEAVITADYDQDCRMDVYVTNGHHFRPFSYAGQHQLFRNTTSNGNHCVEIDLVGTTSNRDGIGAVVYASTPDGKVQKREESNGMHKKAQDFKRLHFGLGANQTVDLEVHWPSGIVDDFTNVTADQVVELVEGTGGAGTAYNLSVSSPSVNEGPSGQQASFSLTLSPAPGTGESVTVAYQTANGTATAGSDYTSTSGTVTFLAGQTQKTVSVPIINDTTAEPTETFTLQATSASTNAASGTATILDDDASSGGPVCGAPTYDPATDRAVFLWNDCGTDAWHLRITGGGSSQYVNHQGSVVADAAFAVVNGVSIEANDTLNVTGSQLNFGLIVGGVYEDGIDFTLAAGSSACFDLTSPTNVPVLAGATRQTVNPQVGIPGFGACSGGSTFNLSVSSPSVNEGPSGQQAAFNLTLSPAPGTGESVTVAYQTVDGTATAGSDYTATSGSVTFASGETQKTVSVPIINDSTAEPTETFTLQATSASTNAASGTATILDDDSSSGGPVCGAPTYDPATDRGVYLWNDCGTNAWHLRITGGGSSQYLNHQGTLVADAAFVAVNGVSIEGNDTLNVTGSQINFGLIVGGVYEDGIDFTLAAGSSVCFTLSSPSGLAAFGGANADAVTLPVSLPSFGACGGGSATCGMPSFDASTDRAAFLWNDCGTNDWHLRITGGGNAQYVSHQGSLVASAPFVAVNGVSVEANDTLNVSASQVDFGLIVGGVYEDGLDFTLGSGANACFTLSSPTDVPVRGGVTAATVGSPVQVPGFGACTP